EWTERSRQLLVSASIQFASGGDVEHTCDPHEERIPQSQQHNFERSFELSRKLVNRCRIYLAPDQSEFKRLRVLRFERQRLRFEGREINLSAQLPPKIPSGLRFVASEQFVLPFDQVSVLHRIVRYRIV